MKSLKIAGLLCLFAFGTAVPALAFNDGLSSDNNVQTVPNGNRTTIKRKHVAVEHDTGTNAEDYNFLGVQGSLGIATQSSGDILNQPGSQLGMMWSAYYERRFIPYVGLRLEGGYNQRGFTAVDANTDATDNFNINFMEFSLLAKAQYPTSIVTPFVAVGPFMGFAVARSESFGTVQGQQVAQASQPLDKDINSFNWGFNFGGGIDFQIVRHVNFEIGARYSLGLSNMLSTARQQAAAGGANQSVSLSLSDIQFISGMSYSL